MTAAIQLVWYFAQPLLIGLSAAIGIIFFVTAVDIIAEVTFDQPTKDKP